jgi:hypothetical protein
MPSSPLPRIPGGIECWPEGDELNSQFIDMVLAKKGNCLLILLKRSDYRYYFNNRTATSLASNRAQRRRQAHDKHWALTFFELQDNQVYRQAERKKDGSWFKARYAVCTYDAIEIIQKAYCNLYHAGR